MMPLKTSCGSPPTKPACHRRDGRSPVPALYALGPWQSEGWLTGKTRN
ncbi:hypothetical protein I553_8398 [Mycobacterium xenopi 4042]|uniref:Uncharacterized protein n=1 Tax=Mycobacterium xenopi 4042 TaxID=1299334 RepID=X8EYP6_MYCXE|nr:hypothetical protein I553_8398 [Mycobacterium xenopi 4042]